MNTTIYTVEQIGRRAFHLESIEFLSGECHLQIILSEDNSQEEATVIYEYPPEFAEVVEALAEACPIHMVGFQDGLLADAKSVWGYVCPCNL